MFCEKCGTPLLEGERFCPNCGAPVGAAKPQNFTPSVNPHNPTPIMVWAIIAVALCSVPFVNLVIAIIARVKVKAYYKNGGLLCGQSKVGSALSKLGLALSIVMLVCWIIIFAAMAVSGVEGFVSPSISPLQDMFGRPGGLT